MRRSFMPAAVAAALTAASLAHAQSNLPGTPGSPPGVIVAPGVSVNPGGTPAPIVPGGTPRVEPVPGSRDRAVSTLPSASGAVSPQAGSLSGSVEKRNRSSGDRLGTPYGNGNLPRGGTYGPSSTGTTSGTGSSPGPSTR